jgi:hypothetical protein
MTIAAVLYTLLAAALGAGAGFLLTGLVQGLLDLSDRPYWLAPALGGVAALVTLVAAWTPDREAAVLLPVPSVTTVTEDTADPEPPDPTVYIEALKRQEPALYAKIKASLRAAREAGKSREVALANARDLLDDYIERKLPYLSNDVIVERFQLLHDILQYLSSKNENDICADLALGIKRSGVQHYLPEGLVARDTANVTRIVATPRAQTAEMLPAEQFRNLTNAAFAHSAAVEGLDLEEVDTLLTGTGDPKKACRLMIGYFKAVVSLPPAESGPALRTLAAGEQATIKPAAPPPAVEPQPAPPAPPAP